jgi:putative ABC transport system permease protein
MSLTNWASWRASVRIARRDALRHKGRSALVIAMIALPVLGVTAADVMGNSAHLTKAERLQRQLGSADASIQHIGDWRLAQRPDGGNWISDNTVERVDPVDLPSLLPTGSRLVRVVSGEADVRAADGGVQPTRVHEIDYTDPLVAGWIGQESGRAPVSLDEVALTSSLARQLHLGIGDTLRTVRPERNYTVVGIVHLRWNRNYAEVVALPGALTAPESSRSRTLVSSAQPLNWDDVKSLNAHGYLATVRSVVLDPPPKSAVPYYALHRMESGTPADAIAAVVVVVGMALLEVVLLAGPAFAVGARRMQRQLALFAVAGAERPQVRNVVLASGVVLGLTGGVLGAALGLALGLLSRSLLLRYTTSDFGGLHLQPLQLAAIAALGLVTGVLAALVPARSASRVNVVTALAGRRGTLRTAKRWPVIGFALIGLGVGITAFGAANDRRAQFIVGGAIVVELGMVACTAALVGLVGRLGTKLPATPRMTLRDAARNRGRTAPAVAAIMAAVAGISAVTVYQTSLDAKNRANYEPSLAAGQAMVSLPDAADRDKAPRLAAALAESLPTRAVHTITAMRESCLSDEPCTYANVEVPALNQCPEGGGSVNDWRCNGGPHTTLHGRPAFGGEVLVGDAAVLAALTGVNDSKAAETLAAGGMVVFWPVLIADGKTSLGIQQDDDHEVKELPGYLLASGLAPAMGFVSPATAARLGFEPVPVGVVAETSRMPTHAEEASARRALAQTGSTTSLYVERGYQGATSKWLLILLIGSAVVTLGASGIVTGLTAVDSRADLATLSAVGAAPRMRRRLMASSAAVTAFLGSVLGVFAGFVPAIGLISSRRGMPVVLPWSQLFTVTVGIPTLAAIFAWVFTRSRLPLPRRGD